jgi:hypothetical protein
MLLMKKRRRRIECLRPLVPGGRALSKLLSYRLHLRIFRAFPQEIREDFLYLRHIAGAPLGIIAFLYAPYLDATLGDRIQKGEGFMEVARNAVDGTQDQSIKSVRACHSEQQIKAVSLAVDAACHAAFDDDVRNGESVLFREGLARALLEVDCIVGRAGTPCVNKSLFHEMVPPLRNFALSRASFRFIALKDKAFRFLSDAEKARRFYFKRRAFS